MAQFTEEMLEEMKATGIISFATASKDGTPNVVPVGMIFMGDDGNIWLVDNYLNKTLANLKENPKANVTITGYADVQTGNPKINMKYSQERAEALKKYITSKYGIDPSRIQTDAKGDTVQPFDEGVKNRVSIVSGKYSVME